MFLVILSSVVSSIVSSSSSVSNFRKDSLNNVEVGRRASSFSGVNVSEDLMLSSDSESQYSELVEVIKYFRDVCAENNIFIHPGSLFDFDENRSIPENFIYGYGPMYIPSENDKIKAISGKEGDIRHIPEAEDVLVFDKSKSTVQIRYAWSDESKFDSISLQNTILMARFLYLVKDGAFSTAFTINTSEKRGFQEISVNIPLFENEFVKHKEENNLVLSEKDDIIFKNAVLVFARSQARNSNCVDVISKSVKMRNLLVDSLVSKFHVYSDTELNESQMTIINSKILKYMWYFDFLTAFYDMNLNSDSIPFDLYSLQTHMRSIICWDYYDLFIERFLILITNHKFEQFQLKNSCYEGIDLPTVHLGRYPIDSTIDLDLPICDVIWLAASIFEGEDEYIQELYPAEDVNQPEILKKSVKLAITPAENPVSVCSDDGIISTSGSGMKMLLENVKTLLLQI